MGINKVQYGNTTLIDLTSDTVTADKLMQGYTAHDRSGTFITGTATGGGSVTQDQDGYIVLPSTGGGGGGGAQELTGTFTGNGGISVQIPCNFAPNLIYVYGDLSGDITLRGIVTFSLIKDMDIYVVSDTSSSGVSEAVVYGTHGISGYNDSSNPHATYSNGILTLDNVTNSSSLRFASGVTYNYNLIGW